MRQISNQIKYENTNKRSIDGYCHRSCRLFYVLPCGNNRRLMERLVKNTNEWRKQVLRQNFYPHEKSNGHIIMVSLDGKYYYEPTI